MKLIFAAIAGLIVVLLLAMLHTGPAHQRVLGLAQEYLRTQQSIELQAEGIDYNLLTLRVRLWGVSLRARAPGNPPPFLRAESAAISLGITRLPFGVLTIKEATVSGLEVQVIQGAAGERNLPSAPESKAGENGSGPMIAVERLRVPGAALQIEDRGRRMQLELPRWDLQVDGNTATLEHRIRFETKRAGALVREGSSMPLERVVLAIVAAADGAKVEEAVVETAGSRIAAAGRLTDWDALDLSGELRVDLAEAGRLFALESVPAGIVEGELQAAGQRRRRA